MAALPVRRWVHFCDACDACDALRHRLKSCDAVLPGVCHWFDARLVAENHPEAINCVARVACVAVLQG